MTRTHITYETAKRLTWFCPELPEPMDREYHRKIDLTHLNEPEDANEYPAYQLHDILSREFCEAVANEMNKHKGHGFPATTKGVSKVLAFAYIDGGLPAVEAELMKMREGK